MTNVLSILDLIGGTPLIRLNRVVGPGAAEVWCKGEHLNPGGSVKDRIAIAMIEDAERRGVISPGRSVIIEPTSGNTGIGLALVCAVKGYRLILTMPESMSLERRSLLSAYGAEIVLTEAERTMEGAVAKAEALCAAHPEYFMPQQFKNRANPEVHRHTTALELVAQLEQIAPGARVDAFVSSVGTGGTISGIGEILKKRFPACRVIALEPATSAVIAGKPVGPHKIQGIGAGFVPEILNRDVIDEVRAVVDRDAWDMKARLAREEGLLVGISAGANVFAACEVARALGPGKRVITILCDTGERYFSLDEHFKEAS